MYKCKSEYYNGNHRKESEKVIKEISINKIWIDSYNDVNSAIEDFKILYDFHISGDVSED